MQGGQHTRPVVCTEGHTDTPVAMRSAHSSRKRPHAHRCAVPGQAATRTRHTTPQHAQAHHVHSHRATWELGGVDSAPGAEVPRVARSRARSRLQQGRRAEHARWAGPLHALAAPGARHARGLGHLMDGVVTGGGQCEVPGCHGDGREYSLRREGGGSTVQDGNHRVTAYA